MCMRLCMRTAGHLCERSGPIGPPSNKTEPAFRDLNNFVFYLSF